jgi:hypothetical protein
VKLLRFFSLFFNHIIYIFVECRVQVPVLLGILDLIIVDICCKLPKLTNCSIVVVQIMTYLLLEKFTRLSTIILQRCLSVTFHVFERRVFCAHLASPTD